MELYNISNITELLSRHGLRFSKAMGQNFLTAKWVPEQIVEAAGIDNTHGVLEIGPGIGVLTKELSKAAGKVAAVELDKGLLPVLDETLAECQNTNIINNNILKTNINELVDRFFNGLTPVVCANLPYNITTPILSALIDSGRFERITVMVQREVARRICSGPSQGDYGAFTVYVNYFYKPEIMFDVPPDCFVPRPKVYSSVIRLDKKDDDHGTKNQELFFKIVRACFAQRRKTMVNGLAPLFGDKQYITQILEQCGLDKNVRGETLGIPQFAAVANAFYLSGEHGI